jgi:hypothetical protein
VTFQHRQHVGREIEIMSMRRHHNAAPDAPKGSTSKGNSTGNALKKPLVAKGGKERQGAAASPNVSPPTGGSKTAPSRVSQEESKTDKRPHEPVPPVDLARTKSAEPDVAVKRDFFGRAVDPSAAGARKAKKSKLGKPKAVEPNAASVATASPGGTKRAREEDAKETASAETMKALAEVESGANVNFVFVEGFTNAVRRRVTVGQLLP